MPSRSHNPGSLAQARRLLLNGLAVLAVLWPLAGQVARTQAAGPDAICVDGGLSGRPFAEVNCVETVATLAEAVDDADQTKLIVVRAFPSRDANSIAGMGTYRDQGLASNIMLGTAEDPVIVQAEGWKERGYYVKPIVDGAERVTGKWTLVPGTE